MVDCKVLAVTLAAVLMLVWSAEARIECPPDNPLCNIWEPCDVNKGNYCRDCNTVVLCTHLGGWVSKCWLPHHQHCVNGQCVNEPSQECTETDATTVGQTEVSEE